MAAMCAVIVTLSLPACAPRNSLTPLAFAAMAVTIRPQLGLIAIVGVAIVLWRNRSTTLSIAAILVGIATLWVAIFFRDTGLPPLSLHPGLNPFVFKQIENPDLYKTTLLSHIVATFWVNKWATGSLSLTALAAIICGWLSVSGKHGPQIRNEFRVLGAFSIAVIATCALLVAALGPVAATHARYHIPIVEGFLFVFWLRSATRVFEQRQDLLLRYGSLPLAFVATLLCLATIWKADKLELPPDMLVRIVSVPVDSFGTICQRLLSEQERRDIDITSSGPGYTLMAITCPIGSFYPSPRVMTDDLFLFTRGDDYDIASGTEGTAKWLQKERVDQLVYLDNDTSDVFGIRSFRDNIEWLKSLSSEAAVAALMGDSYSLESLEMLRKLAQYCPSRRIPIRNPQGPLVIVDVRHCEGQGSVPTFRSPSIK